jgi:phage protein D
MIPTRKAFPSIIVAGRDYYSDLAPYLLSFSYSDNLDKADDLSFTLEDRDRRFITDSFPAKGGAKLEVWILTDHWAFPFNGSRIDCGLFEVDQVSFKWAPGTVDVKACSIPYTSTIKGENKFKAWENKSLDQIASDITTQNEMTVLWDTEEHVRFKRIDQNDQTDLEFLMKQCKEAGLTVKVKRNQIKIFSETEYEKRPPAFDLVFGASEILSASFATKTADTAKESEVEFTDPETGKVTKAKASDSNPKRKTARKVRSYDNPHPDPDLLPDPRNPRRVSVGTLADPPPLIDADYLQNEPDKNAGKGAGLNAKATKKAKADLREANKDSDTASFETIGFPRAEAGQTVQVVGWGVWSGLYFLDSVKHSLLPFQTSLSLRRELASWGY